MFRPPLRAVVQADQGGPRRSARGVSSAVFTAKWSTGWAMENYGRLVAR